MEALARCLDDREYIKWNNKYCVGISIIDEQHKNSLAFSIRLLMQGSMVTI